MSPEFYREVENPMLFPAPCYDASSRQVISIDLTDHYAKMDALNTRIAEHFRARYQPGGDKYEEIKGDAYWDEQEAYVRKIPRNCDRYYPDSYHQDDHTPDLDEITEGEFV